jgi:2-amino-4-hydroxy-6-hydroxymethyldihydropteridine diphosphokinase
VSTAWLGLGSNVDARHNIHSGMSALHRDFEAFSASPVYRSPALGFDGEDFINLVVRVNTDLGPMELKQYLNDLEDRHGRLRDTPKFSDRTLDVDILLYDDLVMITPELELPRPEIFHFAHVLKPLADLDPDLTCPGRRASFSDLWAQQSSAPDGLTRIDFPFAAHS